MMDISFGKPFRIKFSNSNNEFLEIDMSGYLSSLARDLLNEAKTTTKSYYYGMIKDWASSAGKKNIFAITDMYHAISNPESYLTIEDGGRTIAATVKYWVDPSKMQRVKSADKWMSEWRDKLRGEPGLDGKQWQDLPSNEYRAQLMFEEGIIGLPKQSHFRKKAGTNEPYWTNPNQDVYMPLEKYIQSFNRDGSKIMHNISIGVAAKLARKGY